MVAVQAICVFGDNTVSLPNPMGERVYHPHQMMDLVPLAVIVCAPLLGWLLRAAQRKTKGLFPDDVGSHHN